MATIKVFPTHENALNVKHPVSGPLVDTGSFWEFDGFTKSMLATNTVTDQEERGHKSHHRHKPDHSVPPSRATDYARQKETVEASASLTPAPVASAASAASSSSSTSSSVKSPKAAD